MGNCLRPQVTVEAPVVKILFPSEPTLTPSCIPDGYDDDTDENPREAPPLSLLEDLNLVRVQHG